MKTFLQLAIINSFVILFFFACGFTENISGSSLDSLDSRLADTDKDQLGVFNNPSGPLVSKTKCSNNTNCVNLCDSMLKEFHDQVKCYEQTEEKVQIFRDVYNLLAIGIEKNLERIDPEEMSLFLEFGPELWRDAIHGFERGIKENCTPNTNPTDPRLIETCKFKNYYKQDGYWSAGAVSALEWIAKSDWLADLLSSYDEEFIIMKSLLHITAYGGEAFLDDLAEPQAEIANRCNDSNINVSSLPSSTSNKSYKAFIDLCLNNKYDNYIITAVKEKNRNASQLGFDLIKELCEQSANCIQETYCQIDTLSRGSRRHEQIPIITANGERVGIFRLNGWNTNNHGICPTP